MTVGIRIRHAVRTVIGAALHLETIETVDVAVPRAGGTIGSFDTVGRAVGAGVNGDTFGIVYVPTAMAIAAFGEECAGSRGRGRGGGGGCGENVKEEREKRCECSGELHGCGGGFEVELEVFRDYKRMCCGGKL